MADTPDLDLNVLIRAERVQGLAQTLASLDVIPRADRSRVEVIVADASGDDAVAAMLAEFVASGRYPITAVLRDPWPNAAAAWNAAMRRGRGIWVLRLDGGDELACNPLPFLERHPASTSVQFSIHRIQGKRASRRRPRKLTEKNCLRWLTAGNPILTAGLVVRRAFTNHPFDETLTHLHDWAYWMLNRCIFDRPAWERKIVLARVPNTTEIDLDRREVGVERTRVAERMANRLRFQLPLTQRNNLRLQQSCGLRQQGQRAPFLRTLLRVPSDSALYVRGLAYLFLGRMAAHR